MPANHPEFPLNLHFTVKFLNPDYREDHEFLSVEGLQADLRPQLAPKNIFRPNVRRRTILRPHFKQLVLKRAYRPDSELLEWCMDTINNHKREEQNLNIQLLNSKHDIISAWRVENALPVGWNIDEFNAGESKVLIETMTLKYDFFEVVNSKGKLVAPKDR